SPSAQGPASNSQLGSVALTAEMPSSRLSCTPVSCRDFGFDFGYAPLSCSDFGLEFGDVLLPCSDFGLEPVSISFQRLCSDFQNFSCFSKFVRKLVSFDFESTGLRHPAPHSVRYIRFSVILVKGATIASDA